MEARTGNARTWALFSILAEDAAFETTYEVYAMGKDPMNRMPLWIQPKARLTMHDVFDAMSSHYEGTALESGRDAGTGLFSAPYQPCPLA